MFKGIIERTGDVLWLKQTESATQLVVNLSTPFKRIRIGDSVAINGACLTVTLMRGSQLTFDLLEETLSRTNLSDLRPEATVNMERALRLGDRIDGHFVQGHVDTTAYVISFDQQGRDYRLEIELRPDFARYVIFKGSIAVDGVSLTIAEVSEKSFCVWIIPHTREVTNFRNVRAGSRVNLEFDMLGKYVERMLALRD